MNLLMLLEKVFSKNESNYGILQDTFQTSFNGHYAFNLSKDSFIGKIIFEDQQVSKEFDSFQDLTPPFSFSEFHQWWADNMLLSNTEEYKRINDIDFLKSQFNKGISKFQTSFKSKILDGEFCNIKQVTLLSKDSDSDDIIGITTVLKTKDELNRTTDVEPFLNKSVIQTLTADFVAVFFADIKNNSIATIRANPDFLKRNPKTMDYVVYSDFCKYFVSQYLLKEDYENTLISLSKKNILREFNQKNTFFINYRLSLPNGTISYFQIKITKTSEWDSRKTFIIGIHNVDDETKANLEQLDKIKKQTEVNLQLNGVINSLSNDYESIFYIDADNDRVYDFRTSDFIKTKFSHLNEVYISVEKFKSILRKITKENIAEEYQEHLSSITSIRKLRTILKDNPAYYYDFKINVDSKDMYFQMKLTQNLRNSDLVLAFKNIDSQRRAEIQQQKALENARLRAEAANKSKSTFLFNMSHDIRTPMNAIIGYSNMAERYADNPERVVECLEKVKVSSDHLLKLINDVLDMARIENGKIKIEEKPINLHSCINSIVEMEMVNAKKNELDLSVNYENVKTDYIFADSFRIDQILLNIIGNSIKYTRPGGSITVTVKELPSKKAGFAAYDFKVEDTGIGMTQDFLKHIFEMFSRERNTTDSGIQGTGLGMAIVKNLVDLMNGSINIESKLHRGTIVTVHFEFKIQTEKQFKTDNQNENTSSIISLENKRVLLVEDNELNREIARDILQEEGIIVDEADDGTVAVEKFSNSKSGYYDFVLMDVQMPFMDGFQATKLMRSESDPKKANIPIIAMTANAFDEDKTKALQAGMDAHLPKPIKPKLLFQTISDLLIKKEETQI